MTTEQSLPEAVREAGEKIALAIGVLSHHVIMPGTPVGGCDRCENPDKYEFPVEEE